MKKAKNIQVKGMSPNQAVSVEWTSEEQFILEHSLQKYTSEDPIACYASVAQALPGKSIRDVMLRHKWMKEKQRKKQGETSDTQKLLQRNSRILNQIEANISNSKFDENAALIGQLRTQTLAAMSNLSETFHGRMPPFAFKLNHEDAQK